MFLTANSENTLCRLATYRTELQQFKRCLFPALRIKKLELCDFLQYISCLFKGLKECCFLSSQAKKQRLRESISYCHCLLELLRLIDQWQINNILTIYAMLHFVLCKWTVSKVNFISIPELWGTSQVRRIIMVPENTWVKQRGHVGLHVTNPNPYCSDLNIFDYDLWTRFLSSQQSRYQRYLRSWNQHVFIIHIYFLDFC